MIVSNNDQIQTRTWKNHNRRTDSHVALQYLQITFPTESLSCCFSSYSNTQMAVNPPPSPPPPTPLIHHHMRNLTTTTPPLPPPPPQCFLSSFRSTSGSSLLFTVRAGPDIFEARGEVTKYGPLMYIIKVQVYIIKKNSCK